MMYRLVLVAIAWIFIGDAAYPQEDIPNLKDPSMIAAGHDLFLQKQCAHCHGEGLRMPAWREVMTDEEIWKATAYVMSISHQPK